MRPGLILACLLGASALPADAQAAHYVVDIADMAFGPAPARLVVGDTIEWKNSDIFRHTATARDGQFDLDLRPCGRAAVTLSKAGAVQVYCRFHPNMTMRLMVVAMGKG